MNGYFEAWVNSIAWSYSPEERADVARISTEVQKMLGGQVYLAGSQKKNTAIAGSDLDLCIETKEPVTVSQRRELARAITKNLSRQATPRSHVIRVIPGSDIVRIDIAFANAAFGNRKLPESTPFKEQKRMHAARGLKAWLRAGGLPKVGGWAIEALVLELDHKSAASGWELFLKIMKWLDERSNPGALEGILRPYAHPEWHGEWSRKLPGRLQAIKQAAHNKLRKMPESFASIQDVPRWLIE